jgi:hypothetical protein
MPVTTLVLFLVIIGVSVPVLAIVLGIGFAWWKSYIRFQERKLEMQAKSMGAVHDDVWAAIGALSSELAQLRDTSTQYDMSIQHTLDELGHRVSGIESRIRDKSTSSTASSTYNVDSHTENVNLRT